MERLPIPSDCGSCNTATRILHRFLTPRCSSRAGTAHASPRQNYSSGRPVLSPILAHLMIVDHTRPTHKSPHPKKEITVTEEEELFVAKPVERRRGRLISHIIFSLMCSVNILPLIQLVKFVRRMAGKSIASKHLVQKLRARPPRR